MMKYPWILGQFVVAHDGSWRSEIRDLPLLSVLHKKQLSGSKPPAIQLFSLNGPQPLKLCFQLPLAKGRGGGAL